MEQSALEKLKAIGADKIREATRLDLGKIEDILEKRFEKIAPVRAKGFVSMLEKEFSLDLSSWLEEYHQFYNQKNKQEGDQARGDLPCRSHQEKNNFFFWITCTGLFVLGSGFLYWISSQAKIKEIIKMDRQDVQIENSQIQPQETTTQEIAVSQEVSSEEDQSERNIVSQVPLKELDEYGESVFSEIPYDEENILFITANTPLWVGIINLDTKKRVAKIKEEFDIPLDKQLLISIARGGFSASLDDEDRFFNTYKPIYFIHTIKGGLKQISKEEFMLLNGGVEW